MFIGSSYFSDKKTKTDFINTGLIHILVVSGWHIGFLRSNYYIHIKITFSAVKIHLCVNNTCCILLHGYDRGKSAGSQAAIMASCILLSLISNREPLIYNAIALSALIIFIFNPQTLFTASFQLSFMATLGIVYFYPKINNIFSGIKNKIFRFFLGNRKRYFGGSNSFASAFNFLFRAAFCYFLSRKHTYSTCHRIYSRLIFCVLYCDFYSSHLALGISAVLSLILSAVLGIIRFFANLNFSMVDVKVPSIIEIFFYYFALITMIDSEKIRKYYTVWLSHLF
jgi:competence protein ComEC